MNKMHFYDFVHNTNYVTISSCTIDLSCEAYEYNVTGGMCHFLNRTSSATRTLFSDNETHFHVKGRIELLITFVGLFVSDSVKA